MDLPNRKIPPHHLDRTELYTDFETRVAYLHRFHNFTQHDISALLEGRKYLKAVAPTIAQMLYEKLLETDLTAQAFATRNTSEEISAEELEDHFSQMTLSHREMRHRRMGIFLRWYLTRLCGDPSKMEFWMYMDKMAMMHSGLDLGLPHQLDIEFVHLSAALGYLEDFLIETILTHRDIPNRLRVPLLRALNKVIWIQNDFFARWRLREAEEFIDRMEPVRKEGADAASSMSFSGASSSSGSSATPGTPTTVTTPTFSPGIHSSSNSSASISADKSDRSSMESAQTVRSTPFNLHRISASSMTAIRPVPEDEVVEDEDGESTRPGIPGASGCPFSGGVVFETKVWSESGSSSGRLQRKLSKGRQKW